MAIPKPSEINKEGKVLMKWFKKLKEIYQKKWVKTFFLVYFIITFVFIILIIFFYRSGTLNINLNIKSNDYNLGKINASAAFYFPTQISKLNHNYNAELSLQTHENILIIANVYPRPFTINKRLPSIVVENGDCDFSEKQSCTIKFTVNTTYAEEGDFQICVLIRDKLNQQRTFEYCNQAITSLS